MCGQGNLLPMSVIVMGQHIQGLIAATLIGQKGHQVTMVDLDNQSYNEFYDGCKTGDVAHMPFAIPQSLVHQLDLQSYGFNVPKEPVPNPFEKLPFYDGLQLLLEMFHGLNEFRPPYNEKAWRDTWSNFEIGRVLSGYDQKIQDLFAKSATVSLKELLDATDLSVKDKSEISACCILGSKTDPNAPGSAASLLPAMDNFNKNDHVVLRGSLHALTRALKQSAMAAGVTIIDDKTVSKIITEDGNLHLLELSDGQKIAADNYIIDYDPVSLFTTYLEDHPLLPAFRNRITPTKNEKTCMHAKIVLEGVTDSIASQMIAPTWDYITTAIDDMKKGGGSQHPILSVVNCSADNATLTKDGHVVLDVVAQYFDTDVQGDDNHDALAQAVKQVVEQEIPLADGAIKTIKIMKSPTQFGQPNFVGMMPLLQLFKAFSGHHGLAYDFPFENVMLVGYGDGCAPHCHVFDGGARAAALFNS